MKLGIREICDVVLRSKSTQKIGNTIFNKDMPVLYFDSLKTSSLEGAATTVYATGGRGNVRLIAWEGEKTLTFTMEDALISPMGLAILTGAGLMEGVKDANGLGNSRDVEVDKTKSGAVMHGTEIVAIEGKDGATLKIGMNQIPIISADNSFYAYAIPLDQHGDIAGTPDRINITKATTGTADAAGAPYQISFTAASLTNSKSLKNAKVGNIFMIDYYYESKEYEEVTQINIDAENFAGNFYLEASTLFRNKGGVDLPAEFIIPNCSIQSNFTFSMAATGDPSTFTFTMDAFPDYTKYDKTKKVLCAIRILQDASATDEKVAPVNELQYLTTSEAELVENQKEPVAAGLSATSRYSWKSTDTTD